LLHLSLSLNHAFRFRRFQQTGFALRGSLHSRSFAVGKPPAMSAPRASVIGIVGGVGSGKSALAKWVNENLSAAVLDADAAGHRALEKPEVEARIREQFGPDVFDATGRIIRSRLAELVFGPDEPQQAARRRLEQIVHPVIRLDLEQQLRTASESHELVILDAAVALESGWGDVCDAIVFVEVPEDVRRERVGRTRNWSADELAERESSQMSLRDKRAAAEVIIDNSGLLEDAGRQFENWYRTWRRLRSSRGANDVANH
jgi:dephospho-CoA kinase